MPISIREKEPTLPPPQQMKYRERVSIALTLSDTCLFHCLQLQCSYGAGGSEVKSSEEKVVKDQPEKAEHMETLEREGLGFCEQRW